MKKHVFPAVFSILFLASCIVQSPKYTSLENVMSLKPGMSKMKVEEILGVEPYDLKATNDSTKVFVYVYRVTDRKTLSFTTTPTNGKITTGKYVQLFVTYSNLGQVISIESCSLCPDNLVSNKRLDFEKVFAFITVTLPALLLYFGLKAGL